MRILIDLQHPAHLHFFRHLINRLISEGHDIKLTGRDKDILPQLARSFGLEVEFFGTARPGVLNLARELIFRQWRLRKIIRGFHPQLILAIAGTYVSMLGKFSRVPVYLFYDTEHATLSNLLAYPFASRIYLPQCYRKTVRYNNVRYNGYHELAYLHPNYFTPDPGVMETLGLKSGELFSLVRFVGWAAAHDLGRSGFTPASKVRAVEELCRYGRVFISVEGELPAELEQYRLKLDFGKIHDLMAYAALIFGESATMVSEGAVLGVPGIFLDPVGRGYTDEQEKRYGLVFNFTPARQEAAIDKAVTILKDSRRAEWQEKGKRLIADKIDVTRMLHEIVINYRGA